MKCTQSGKPSLWIRGQCTAAAKACLLLECCHDHDSLLSITLRRIIAHGIDAETKDPSWNDPWHSPDTPCWWHRDQRAVRLLSHSKAASSTFER